MRTPFLPDSRRLCSLCFLMSVHLSRSVNEIAVHRKSYLNSQRQVHSATAFGSRATQLRLRYQLILVEQREFSRSLGDDQSRSGARHCAKLRQQLRHTVRLFEDDIVSRVSN